MCNLLNCYKSLLRVRGDKGLDAQISQLESEWAALLKDAQLFQVDVNQMKLDNKLLLGTRAGRNYKNGQLMEVYKERELYIPYFCFWKKNNIFKWETVSKILALQNASFDETLLHMWVYRGMRDYYWRANVIAGHLEQLLNYKYECETALAIERIDFDMLPDEMRQIPKEKLLPGY